MYDMFPWFLCVDFPISFIKEAAIDKDVAAMFTKKVRTPVTIAKSVLTACIVLGILWIATAGFVTVYILMKVSNGICVRMVLLLSLIYWGN